MQSRGLVIILGMLLASAVLADAGVAGSSRKLLQNYYNRRPIDRTSAQLAANNRAIVNTQYAIRSAVESGANPAVTRGATYYGSDQAYWAAQSGRCGRWFYGYSGLCGKK